MFRDMIRFKQLMDQEGINEILEKGSNGILACLGDEGYPYAVPVNYVYHDGKIYFHSGKKGHKMDAIQANPKVSFAVVGEDTIVSKEYTSYFRSVIAFGKARIAEGEEWESAFWALVEKYSGDQPEAMKKNEIDKCKHAYIIAIDIEHMTGKRALELV